MNPYIGITGFRYFSEVEKMLDVFKRGKPPANIRDLMVGVMMSRKTMLGLPSKFTEVFPHKSDVARIFGSDETYNCLHYVDYDGGSNNVPLELAEAIGHGGIGIHALQLDMVWPDPDDIWKAIRISRKSIDVILQVGAGAIDKLDGVPDSVAKALADYNDVVGCVLLDMSMGQGIPLQAKVLLPLIDAIKAVVPDMDIAVAGGLGPSTLGLVDELVLGYPNISIDAQAKVCLNEDPMKMLDMKACEEYITKALVATP